MRRITNRLIAKLRPAVLASLAFVASLGLAVTPLTSSDVSAACGSGCVASMSLSPGSGTYNPGNTVTVSIYVNSGGQTVNAVQADFTYTSSRLQFQSINATGSAFAIDASSTGGGGSVSIARGNISAVSGSSLLVAKVNFTVLSGNDGTATLTLGSSSTVASSTTNQDILGSKSGASYTVTTPAPPTPPPATGGGSTPPPSSTPTTTTTPKTTTSTPTTTTAPKTETPPDKKTETPSPTESTPTPTSSSGSDLDVVEDASTSSALSPTVIAAIAIGALTLLGGAAFAVRHIMKSRQAAYAPHVTLPDGPVIGSANPQPYQPHQDVTSFGSYNDNPSPHESPSANPGTDHGPDAGASSTPSSESHFPPQSPRPL